MSIYGDAGYPAGASSDPYAPFNLKDAELCKVCETQLDEDLFCSNENKHFLQNNIYKAKFWVPEIDKYLTWENSQAFWNGDY